VFARDIVEKPVQRAGTLRMFPRDDAFQHHQGVSAVSPLARWFGGWIKHPGPLCFPTCLVSCTSGPEHAGDSWVFRLLRANPHAQRAKLRAFCLQGKLWARGGGGCSSDVFTHTGVPRHSPWSRGWHNWADSASIPPAPTSRCFLNLVMSRRLFTPGPKFEAFAPFWDPMWTPAASRNAQQIGDFM